MLLNGLIYLNNILQEELFVGHTSFIICKELNFNYIFVYIFIIILLDFLAFVLNYNSIFKNVR